MRLKRIQIKNFCNIEDSEIEFGDMTVIVGKNDIGKSNVLKAVDILLRQDESVLWHETIGGGGGRSPGGGTQHSKDYRYFRNFETSGLELRGLINLDPDELDQVFPEDEVEIEAEGTQIFSKSKMNGDVTFSLSFRVNEDEIEWIVGELAFDGGPELIRWGDKARRDDYAGLSKEEDGSYSYVPNATVLRSLLRMFRKSHMVIRGDRTLQRTPIATRDDAQGYQYRSIERGVVEDLFQFEKDVTLLKSDIFSKVNRDITALFPKYGRVASMTEGEQWKSVYYDRIPSSSVGDGVRQLTVLSFHLRNSTAPIVSIEEPEIHLHPETQRDVLRLLGEESRKRQIILTSHSSTIAGVVDVGDLRLVRDAGDGSSVVDVIDEDNLGLLANELGVSVRDVFEPEVVVFVEGADDAVYFEALWQKVATLEGLETSVTFIECGGWLSMQYYAETKVLRNLGRPFCLVFDGDTEKSEKTRERKKRLLGAAGVSDDAVFTLSKDNIEHYLMVPEAIHRRYPGISTEDANKALSRFSGKRNKKEVLSHLFDDSLDLEFGRDIGLSIIEAMKPEEISRDLVEILKGISELPGRSARTT